MLNSFLSLSNTDKLKLSFSIHDFNGDESVDYNDAYDLLYTEK